MAANAQTVLYVDDDADDREFFSDALSQVNPAINVVCAGNGLEALEYLSTINNSVMLPCLIVLDLNMPYLDGRETFEKIKENPGLQNIPVVVFTSSSNPNDKISFNNVGIDFITKPNNLSYMNKIASRLLENCSGKLSN